MPRKSKVDVLVEATKKYSYIGRKEIKELAKLYEISPRMMLDFYKNELVSRDPGSIPVLVIDGRLDD